MSGAGEAVERIRVVIADDHTLFRDGVRALLASAPDTELAGEAATGEDVLRLAAELQPDVILMDMQMPGVNGIEATRRIVQMSPHVSVLMVTMFEDDASVFAAIRAGARGYLLKGATRAEMLRAIRAAANGEAIFSPPIAARLIAYFSERRPVAPPQVFPELSDREREILARIAQGYSNTEIAEHFVLSPKTVRNHVSNIISKLQVADRAEAVLRAREAGMG